MTTYADAMQRVMEANGGQAPLRLLCRKIGKYKEIRGANPQNTIRARAESDPRFVCIGNELYALKSWLEQGKIPKPQTNGNGAAKPLPAPAIIEEDDCFNFLDKQKAGMAGLVLTDPPYAISRKTGFKDVVNGVQRFAVSMDFGKWDHQEIDLNLLAEKMYKILRKGGTAVVWYDLWKLTPLADALCKAGFRMLRLLVWEKSNPVPLNSKKFYLSNSREIAVAAVKSGGPVFNGEYHNGVYSSPIPRHNGRRIHPTQKPVDLFREIIGMNSKPGDVVVDPFLGSGTTAVAALMEGRKFHGCEIDRKYVQAARERVKNVTASYKQQTLIVH